MTEQPRQRKGASTATSVSTTTSAPTITTIKKRRVVIVGGGPAGAATAVSLAKRHHDNDGGLDIELYESYPHPSQIPKNNSKKAYVIALGKRGYYNLQKATGIDDILTCMKDDGAVTSSHMARHPNPKNKPPRKHTESPSLIVPRQVLAGKLLSMAESVGVKVYFQHMLQDVDFTTKTCLFQDKTTAATKEVQYDLLIGADGSNSVVRTLLDKKLPEDEFQVHRLEQDSMEYQVTMLPSTKTLFPKSNLPPDTVHAWNNKEYNAICLAFPIVDNNNNKKKEQDDDDGDQLMFTVVFPEGKFQEFKDNYNKNTKSSKNDDNDDDNTKNKNTYSAALGALFPDVPDDALQDMTTQLVAGEPANGGTCIWTSSLGHGSVALVGDSGHGMWPSLGQGGNCALETVAVFCDTVSDSIIGNDDINKNITPDTWACNVVAEFNTRRHADAMAAVDLTYGGIGARTSRGRGNAPLSYKLQFMTMMLLHKMSFGILVPKPAMMRLLLGDHTMSYSHARQMNFYTEKYICMSAAAAIVAAVVAFWKK